ncbi:Alpha/Beta hydrolase protein [Xylariaceae sp. FL0255]|nr:Alpha/Beta hydrolase protein [Xylariaceae sp. FL0255]
MDKKLRQLGFKEANFHTGEVILNYVTGPPSKGPPIVFLHGQTETWDEYTLIMPKLCDKFTVYSITQRGHGRSTWTPGMYSFNALGRDISKFLREVVREPAIVVGNSSGGVLTTWLAANAKEYVKAIVLEDPPLFRCEHPAIMGTTAYDLFLAFTRTTVPNGGGLAALFRDFLVPVVSEIEGVLTSERRGPPKWALLLIGRLIGFHQFIWPGAPIDFWFLPQVPRRRIRCMSQFDGNFSRAFVDGSMGKDFDHAEALARVEAPVLFLHAKYFMHKDGKLLGALTHDDVERVRGFIKGKWKYVDMKCGHAIAIDAPQREAEEIMAWAVEEGLLDNDK